MATPDIRFGPMAVDGFCCNLQKVVADAGGPAGFFAKLEENSAAVFANFDIQNYRILNRLLDDTEFRGKFICLISEENERNFLEEFLKSWELWSEVSPGGDEYARATLIVVYDQLLQSIPLAANDPQYCNSTLFIDTLTETLRVKTLLRLISPDKDLGGKHCFLIASTLERFLGTIMIMLGSIRLRGTEISLFKIPDNRKIDPVIKALREIQRIADDLQAQFEGMRSLDAPAVTPRRE